MGISDANFSFAVMILFFQMSIFSRSHVEKLLYNKFIVIIGDSGNS